MIKLLGITDERTSCEKCGKSNLKKTIALDIDEQQVYYGSDCAAKVLYGSKEKMYKKAVEQRALVAQIAKEALTTLSAARRIEQLTDYKAKEENGQLWVAFHFDIETVFVSGIMRTLKHPRYEQIEIYKHQ